MSLLIVRVLIATVVASGIAVHASIEQWRHTRLGADIARARKTIHVENAREYEHRIGYERTLDACVEERLRRADETQPSAHESIDGRRALGEVVQ